ncbi:MAG: transposase [Okeania sp. SIO3B5]|uniref:RNA-guided endonuclease InsQ/TnpB family protein n=1 Tax=Okeania sp. SIO3B5 TaxID=2607811 RepID=UPI0013FEAD4B|nr:transposase [Okeania sp. SIO3B5]
MKTFLSQQKANRKVDLLNLLNLKVGNHAQTARFRKGGFKIGQHKVYLAKIGKLKIVWSRELPGPPSSVTVIKDSANRYFLSFVVEIQPEVLPQTDNSVGIDLGIKTFATFSDGTKVDAPKPLKKRIKKYIKLSKSLSHKTKGSKRYEKARVRVAKFHAKLKDTRTDFLHKLSTEIIRENQTVVLEV